MTQIDLDARKAKKEAARANQYPRPETTVEPVIIKKAKKRARKNKG